MKNIIFPETLAQFQKKPIPFSQIEDYLNKNPKVTVRNLCDSIGIHPQQYYQWRSNQKKIGAKTNETSNGNSMVNPKGASKKQNRYSPQEKLTLIKEYFKASKEEKGALLRKYGIYHSDMTRWQEMVDRSAVQALATRKPRNGKISDEQGQIEKLKNEVQVLERKSAKLSSMLELQKKVLDFLKEHG